MAGAGEARWLAPGPPLGGSRAGWPGTQAQANLRLMRGTGLPGDAGEAELRRSPPPVLKAEAEQHVGHAAAESGRMGLRAEESGSLSWPPDILQIDP